MPSLPLPTRPEAQAIALALASAIALSAAWWTPLLAPLLFVAFVPLLLLQDKLEAEGGADGVRLFRLAFLSFGLWQLSGTWWAARLHWGATALPVLLGGLGMAGVFWLFHLAKKRLGHSFGYMGLLLFWLAYESLQQQGALGFPWRDLGVGIGALGGWVGWYAYLGTPGGSAWVLLVNLLVHRTLRSWLRQTPLRWVWPVGALAVLAAVVPPLAWAGLKPAPSAQAGQLRVGLVQNLLDPLEKYDSSTFARQEADLLRLAELAIAQGAELVILPETSWPRGVWDGQADSALGPLLELGRRSGADILVGVHSFERLPAGHDEPLANPSPQGDFLARNSSLLLHQGRVLDIHHKSKLMPGAETVPLGDRWAALNRLSARFGEAWGPLAPDPSPRSMAGPDSLSLAVLLCWESVFGGYAASLWAPGPGLVVVQTNDGWWGDSPVMDEHLAHARLRALEAGRWLARAGSNGGTAFIAPDGSLAERAPDWQEAVLVRDLPLLDGQGSFAQNGDPVGKLARFFGALLLLYLFAAPARDKSRRPTR